MMLADVSSTIAAKAGTKERKLALGNENVIEGCALSLGRLLCEDLSVFLRLSLAVNCGRGLGSRLTLLTCALVGVVLSHRVV